MAVYSLLIPYWTRRIARLFARPEESEGSVQRAPAKSPRGSDAPARSAPAREEKAAQGQRAARGSRATGRDRRGPRPRASSEPPPETLSVPDSLLVPYLKARIARAFSDGPAVRRVGRSAASLAVPDERGVTVGEARGAPKELPVASKVRFPTFAAIGVADVALPMVTSSTGILGLELVGGLGGVGLMAVSALDLKKAKTTDEKLDAVNSFSWGTQALCYLASSAAVHTAAMGFGLVGAATQAVVGVRRIKQGLAEDDRRLTGLGALDVGSGVVWFAGTAMYWPLFLGSYALMMIGREAYVNDRAVKGLLQVIQAEMQDELATARAIVADTAHLLREAVALEPAPAPVDRR
jgi:hypothetical protein